MDGGLSAARDPGRGVASALAAYLLWGVFPLYFPLLEPAGALEILAHRIVWTVVCCALVLALGRRALPWRGLSGRQLRLLAVAAWAIAVNWGVYIGAVNTGHVVEAALGYYINPLVSVLLGVVVLRERLRRLQWAAVALAALAVTVLTVALGHLPWIALTLALSFGSYGLLKKKADVDPLPSLSIESAVLAPVALAVVAAVELTGNGSLGEGTGHLALLASTGVVTAVPLLLFGAAAVRVPLSVLGLLQYVTPTLQLGIGVLVRHEEMTPARWAGFALVWCSLTVFAADQLRGRRAGSEDDDGRPRPRVGVVGGARSGS